MATTISRYWPSRLPRPFRPNTIVTGREMASRMRAASIFAESFSSPAEHTSPPYASCTMSSMRTRPSSSLEVRQLATRTRISFNCTNMSYRMPLRSIHFTVSKMYSCDVCVSVSMLTSPPNSRVIEVCDGGCVLGPNRVLAFGMAELFAATLPNAVSKFWDVYGWISTSERRPSFPPPVAPLTRASPTSLSGVSMRMLDILSCRLDAFGLPAMLLNSSLSGTLASPWTSCTSPLGRPPSEPPCEPSTPAVKGSSMLPLPLRLELRLSLELQCFCAT
mmetsp:Transcript_6768/g.18753  ORF Transcript_6768/g.18753 Transcript_6768/m.18753 type:complete len:276 (-) Transcript_6768:915-1742(-)